MIILDTHTWVWWIGDTIELSKAALNTIAAADTIGVCSISCWEVAMLVGKRRLQLDRDPEAWVARALSIERVVSIPLTPDIAVDAAMLPPPFHRDPVDRILMATAMRLDATLVTKDEKILASRLTVSVW